MASGGWDPESETSWAVRWSMSLHRNPSAQAAFQHGGPGSGWCHPRPPMPAAGSASQLGCGPRGRAPLPQLSGGPRPHKQVPGPPPWPRRHFPRPGAAGTASLLKPVCCRKTCVTLAAETWTCSSRQQALRTPGGRGATRPSGSSDRRALEAAWTFGEGLRKAGGQTREQRNPPGGGGAELACKAEKGREDTPSVCDQTSVSWRRTACRAEAGAQSPGRAGFPGAVTSLGEWSPPGVVGGGRGPAAAERPVSPRQAQREPKQ